MMKKLLTILIGIALASVAFADYEVLDVKMTVKGLSQKGKSHHYKYETERLNGMLVLHTETNGMEHCEFILYSKHDYAQLDCDLDVSDYSHKTNSVKGMFTANLAVEPFSGSGPDIRFNAVLLGAWRNAGKHSSVTGKGAALFDADEKGLFNSEGYSKNVIIRKNTKLTAGINDADDAEEYLEEQIANKIRTKVGHVDIDLHP